MSKRTMQDRATKRYPLPSLVLAFLWIVGLGNACTEPVPKQPPKANAHPKLINTIGDPNYGNVQCILQDMAGNLWFGTSTDGLYKYDGKSFARFMVADGLNSNEILSLLEDRQGRLWIGTSKGIMRNDGQTFAPLEIPLPSDLSPNENNRYANKHRVFSMIQPRNGNIWFMTIDGVLVYDGTSFSNLDLSQTQGGYLSTNHNVEHALEDKNGNIWMGGRGNQGVFRYDGKSIQMLQLDDLYQDGPTPKPHNWAWPQLQDRNGNIWFGNWGGAYRYDGSTFTSFTKKDGLHGGVTTIIEDRKGNLWFGGDAGAGLSRFDGKTFTRFTTKDGLVHNSIWALLEDHAGNLWIGTRSTGLSLFDGTTFETYSEYQRPPSTAPPGR